MVLKSNENLREFQSHRLQYCSRTFLGQCEGIKFHNFHNFFKILKIKSLINSWSVQAKNYFCKPTPQTTKIDNSNSWQMNFYEPKGLYQYSVLNLMYRSGLVDTSVSHANIKGLGLTRLSLFGDPCGFMPPQLETNKNTYVSFCQLQGEREGG